MAETSGLAARLRECLDLVEAEDRIQVRDLQARIAELERERQRFGDLVAELGRHLDVMGRHLPPEQAAGVDGHQAVCRRLTRLATAYAEGKGLIEPCPEGFHWIGQHPRACEKCGLPAWEHAGQAVHPAGAGVFDLGKRWELRPWKPGEADALRARWEPRG